jgi:hypothetical protein
MELRNRTWRACAGWVAALSVLLAVGCGPGGSLYPVKGKVTYDGKEVKSGVIRFVPAGGGTPVGGEIKDGEYTCKAPAGPARVEITAQVAVGTRKAYDMPDSPTIEDTKPLIPEKYNSKSELTYTVEPKPNEKNFDLPK